MKNFTLRSPVLNAMLGGLLGVSFGWAVNSEPSFSFINSARAGELDQSMLLLPSAQAYVADRCIAWEINKYPLKDAFVDPVHFTRGVEKIPAGWEPFANYGAGAGILVRRCVD